MTDITSLALRSRNATLALRQGGPAPRNSGPANPPPSDPTLNTPLALGARPVSVESEVRRLLSGGGLVSAADARAAQAPGPDDARFFATFRALDSLRALALAATRDPVRGERSEIPPTLRARANTLFQSQLGALRSFVDGLDFRDVIAVSGAIEPTLRADRFFANGGFDYVGAPVAVDSTSAEVPAFQGALRFSATIRVGENVSRADFDLSDISGPRSLDSVAAYINAQLAAAGAVTRLSVVALGPENANGIVDSGRFGFRVEGISLEQVSFAAPATGPAAFLVNPRAAGGAEVSRVVGLAGTPEARALTTLTAQDGTFLPRASALGPDGSLFVVSEASGSVGGEALKGDRDVILQRIDSTGKILFTRTLGAGGGGQGFSVAVDAGGNVVVAGALRGRLDPLTPVLRDSGLDGFVARFDASGREIFTRQLARSGDNFYTAVAFAPDGGIVLGGETSSSLVEGQGADGREAFVEQLDADGQQQFLRQLVGAGDDRVDSLVVDDTGRITLALNSAGRGIVQEIGGATSNDPAPGFPGRRIDLGTLDGGRIAGLALDGNGDVVIAGDIGANGSAGLLAGALAGDRGGARDGFVARLAPAADGFSLQFARALGAAGAGSEQVTGLALSNGTLLVSGTTDAAFGGAPLDGPRNPFLAQIDASSGALNGVTTLPGSFTDNGGSLTLSPEGENALNRLGLPTGPVQFTDSDRITDRSSARAGDSFTLQIGTGPPQRITLRSTDTLTSLAFRINQALRLDGRAELRTATLEAGDALTRGDAQADRIAGGTLTGRRLVFEPRPGRQLTLTAGAAGEDLLAALGLRAGIVYAEPTLPSQDRASPTPRFLELSLDESLTLDDSASAQRAANVLVAAQSAVRNAFRAVNAPPPAANASRNANGPVPEFLSAQLANLRAGLARLQAGQTQNTGGGNGNPLLSIRA